MKYIITLYRFIKPFKMRMAVFLMVVTGAVVVESIRPYWLKKILDSVESGSSESVMFYFILFGTSMVGGNALSALGYFLGDSVLFPLARNIRETIFNKILELDFAFHVNKNTGSLISAFKRGDGAVFNIFFNIHQELYRVLISLAVTLAFLWGASPVMAAMLGGVFILNLVLIWYLITINLRTRTEFNDAEDDVSAVITDSLLNYETVKFFAAEHRERQKLSDKFEVWTQKLWKFSNSFRLMDIGIGTTAGAGMLSILWIAVSKVGRGFSLGDLVMVSGFLTSFYYQFFNLFFRIRDIAKSLTDLEKYMGILENEVQVKDPVKAIEPSNLKGKVEFRDVRFSYPKDKGVTLDGVNITINSNQQVAFVGRSGAGKTTLIKLLLRFYDPSSGTILVDDVDIRHMNKSFVRSLMGVVPQEPIMFNNTLRYNLAYGREHASDEELKEAARKANILDFIEKLPDGWATEVGERGIKLSGGQKQRLAIARALLANPKILIFDEATSNLDSESEEKIQAALNNASAQRTVIIIAHRFSTIRNADKIVVLSNGKVVEEGKHGKLIAKDGIYKKLWELQAKGKLDQA